jgi:hypothetical protein
MHLTEIRRQLDALTAPGAAPDPTAVAHLRSAWEGRRSTVLPAYWPIIDDRLALLERRP